MKDTFTMLFVKAKHCKQRNEKYFYHAFFKSKKERLNDKAFRTIHICVLLKIFFTITPSSATITGSDIISSGSQSFG